MGVPFRQSIRTKLLAASALTIILAFGINVVVVVATMSSLVADFQALNRERASANARQLTEASKATQEKVRTLYETELRKKGEALIAKDMLVLKPAFLENSYSGIRGFLDRVFEFDAEILEASFFTVKEGDIRAWHHLTRARPEGLPLSNRYDLAQQAWVDQGGGAPLALDQGLAEVLQIKGKRVALVERQVLDQDGKTRQVKAYDCAIPVVEGDDVAAAKAHGAAVGYLRYIIALDKMEAAVAREEQQLALSLQSHEVARRLAEADAETARRKVEARSRVVLFASAVLILALALGISLWTGARLARPLRQLTASAANVARGDYGQSVVVLGDGEIGELGRSFEAVRVQIKGFTENLQGLIDERTRELARALTDVTEQKHKIQEILDHIDQGIMTAGADLCVERELSQFLAKFYGVALESLVGRDLIDLVFSHSQLSPDQLAILRAVLSATVGEDMIAWELNGDHLPREQLVQVGGSPRIVALDWNAITDKRGVVQRIMLSLRDLTHQRDLERKIAAERERSSQILTLIGEVIGGKSDAMRRFIPEVRVRLARLVGPNQRRRDDLISLKRELHTIKGGARVLGLKTLASSAHLAEEALAMQNGADLSALQLVVADIEQYTDILDNILAGGAASGRSQPSGALLNNSVPLRPTLADLCLIQLGPLQQQLRDGGLNLAGFACNDLVGRWNPSCILDLSGILTHALANAADHGYILPYVRGNQNREARFAVTAALVEGTIVLSISDEGAGLDMEKISALAAQRGFIPEPGRSVVDVLFEDGMSTAEQATMTSGRGVGMASIRATAQALGGDATLGANPNAAHGTMLVVRMAAQLVCDGSMPPLQRSA